MPNQPKNLKKKEAVQKSRNTLLVIGNGFDLYCGFETKYSDYFKQASEKNRKIKRWLEESQIDLLRAYIDLTERAPERSKYWQSIDGIEEINTWDVLFYLVSPNDETLNDKNWCDVEKSMLCWLSEKESAKLKVVYPSAQKISSVLQGKQGPAFLTAQEIYLAALIFKKHGERPFSDDYAYYDFLLSQLNQFEHNFGNFIKRQLSSKNNKGTKAKKLKPIDLLNKLCSPGRLISIDTFNYGPVKAEEAARKVHHINGDTERPIFGVDSGKFEPADPRYIFTKTYRRMILDSQSTRYRDQFEFETVVVFGHSLNEADYNYFIPVLDKLKIMDFTSPSIITFAFSVYDQAKGPKIRCELVKSISNLFFAYSKYKGNIESPSRLLDSLTTQGKVVLYEVK